MLYSDNETKKLILRSVLLILDQILRLLHPIQPFVTEEIYGQIWRTVVTAEYPGSRVWKRRSSSRRWSSLKMWFTVVTHAEVNVAPSANHYLIKTSDSKARCLSITLTTSNFTNPEHEIAADVEVPDLLCQASSQVQKSTCHLLTFSMLDKNLARLEKELAKWQKNSTWLVNLATNAS